MNTCATCRFMAAERDYRAEHHSCVRIIHGNGYGEREDGRHVDPAKEPAYVVDGSGYAARLCVLPTFGCVLHEAKS